MSRTTCVNATEKWLNEGGAMEIVEFLVRITGGAISAIALIWAINTLFGLCIDFTWQTISASFFITLFVPFLISIGIRHGIDMVSIRNQSDDEQCKDAE